MSNNNQYIPSGSYQVTSSSIKVTVKAQCETAKGIWQDSPPVEYALDNSKIIKDITNLDGKLTIISDNNSTPNSNNNLGRYVPAGSYQLSSRNISVTIQAQCQSNGTTTQSSSIAFDAQEAVNIIDITNINGTLKVNKRAVGNHLDNAKIKWSDGANYDQLKIDESTLIGVKSDGNIFVVDPNRGVSTISTVGGVIVTKTLLGPGYKLVGSVAFMRVASDGTSNGLDTVDVAIFEAHADAEYQPLYAGAGVGFNLAGGSASIFDFNLGAGLSTGIGLKNESIELKVAGTGVTIGRKISISVLDTSFGIDLERTAHAVWFVGNELAVAVAIVPGALKDSGVALLEEFKSMPGTFAKAGVDIVSEAKKIPGAFAQIPGAFADAGKQLGGMVAGGATSVGKGVADTATDVAKGAANIATDIYDTGKNLGGKAVDGVVDVAKDTEKAAEKVVGKLNPFN